MTQESSCTADTAPGEEEDPNVQEAVDVYLSSLADLTVNSKPHINSLTMLAEDYLNYAEAIVNAVDTHLKQVPSNVKLPVLYLIDSIVKNVGKDYISLFSRVIVSSFCSVFEQVDEKTRTQMYKLRQTWNHIYSNDDLYAMDVRVHNIDPNWPITAEKPTGPRKIHVNPRFLQSTGGTNAPAAVVAAAISGGAKVAAVAPATPLMPALPIAPTAAAAAPKVVQPDTPADDTPSEAEMREELLRKKRGQLKLEQEKVNQQLSQMKAKLDKKQRLMTKLSEIASQQQKCCPQLSEKSSAPVVAGTTTTSATMSLHSKVTDARTPGASEVKAAAATTAPRIAPISGGLLTLATNQRVQRDPRLKQNSEPVATSDEATKSRISNRDPRLGSKSETQKSKAVEEDRSSRRSRSYSRETSPERSGRHSGRREHRDKRSSEGRKSGRKSEERSSPRSKKSSNLSPSKNHKRDRRRNRSRDRSRDRSHDRSRERSRDRSREHSREKSRDKSHGRSCSPRSTTRTAFSRVVSDCADLQLEAEGGSEEVGKNKSVSPRAPAGSSEWNVNYTKGSLKGRNYKRQNRLESPEPPTDVDLRISAEKQPRLIAAKEGQPLQLVPPGVPEQILPTLACQDVDLRRLQASPGKKRQSAEPDDGHLPSKKNKAAYMDMLFGNQDVDLRQLNPAKAALNNGLRQDAPSPPPPPIISGVEVEAPPPPHLSPQELEVATGSDRGWTKFKQLQSPTVPHERSPFSRSSRRGLYSRSENDHHRGEDTDMRALLNGRDVSKPNLQAILAGATEQLKNGTMSRSDFDKVQQQVFCMQESEKLKEAQRNDFTRREAWERRPREKDYRHGLAPPSSEHFGDVDERYGADSQANIIMPRPTKKPLLPLPSIPPMPLQDDTGPSHRPHHGGPRMPASIRSSGRGGLLRLPHWRQRGGRVDNAIPLPVADPLVLEKIAQDPMKSIVIDGVSREIRFYGSDAVVFLNRNEPCEISFEHGEAKVVVDDNIVFTCAFHDPAKEIEIDGHIHRVWLGAPSRELYIDDQWYECQFNQPPIEVILRPAGTTHLVQLQGDMPKVHIGRSRRDLVAGRILLVIDAKSFLPIYLDAKPQRFDIDGVPHIMRFMDALRTVLVNGHPFNIEFGGNPVPITVNNARHYIRLTELPPGVVPGEVDIVSMAGIRGKAHAPALPSHQSRSAMSSSAPEHDPVLPIRPSRMRKVPGKYRRDRELENEPPADNDSGDRQMPPELLSAIQPGLPSLYAGLYPAANGPGYGIASSAAPVKSSPHVASNSSSQEITNSNPAPLNNGTSILGSELNMDELFQRLIATGIVSSLSTISDTKKEAEVEKNAINEVDFKEPQTLKSKQPGIINILYSGIQCSSCGTRFPPEQTVKYSQHLDWHFRQNRRDRDSARKPQSRKWYYDVADWIQYEEIEDVEDRAQSWFETQQGESQKVEEPEPEEVQSLPTNEFSEEIRCELCHDRFEQFYNEEKEEWHYKHCIQVDNVTYHPLCFKDYRVCEDSSDEMNPDGEATKEENDVDMKEDEVVTEGTEEKIETGEDTKDEVQEEEKMELDDEPDKALDSVQNDSETELKEEEGNVEEKTENVEEKVGSVEEKAENVEEKVGSVEEKAENVEEKADDEKTVPIKAELLDGDNVANTSEAQNTDPELGESDIKTEPSEEPMDTSDLPGLTADKGEMLETEEDSPKTDAGSSKVEEGEEEAKDLDTPEPYSPSPVTDTTHTAVSCSIDGNLELGDATKTLKPAPAKIKINISKPLGIPKPTPVTVSSSPVRSHEKRGSSPDPPPPGEETSTTKLKLIGRKLTDLPPVYKGDEMSGLCSIM